MWLQVIVVLSFFQFTIKLLIIFQSNLLQMLNPLKAEEF